jgi:TolB-like protein/tetratricopeptide (TPR) repeat protein
LRADGRALADLAASVADGQAVDWQSAQSGAAERDRRLIQHLRLVESIAGLYRSLPAAGPLTDLAASVADGQAVDWQGAESGAAQRDRRLIQHLKLVESIATLYRSLPADPDAEADIRRAAEPAGPRWGRLVMLDRIGEGTSCEVYRAWDSELHREVALKLLHDEGPGNHDSAHARVLEEARRLARIRHPHVVQVYGAEQHDGRVGLWMELVRGESLEQVLKTRGAFGAREAALTGLEVCASLAAVHGAGLLHRDVKAQNVMRESGGRLVLMDFGTGEELRRDTGSSRMVGTPLYLAPEIFAGRSASVQSDLYSVGVLLFYLATGEFPVMAASMEQLARAHAHRQRRMLRDLRPDLPEAFVRVVERALHTEPARRYTSAGELEAALREALDKPGRAIDLAPAQEHVVAKGLVARPWSRFGLAAGALALVAAVVGLIVWSRTVESNRGTVLSGIRTIAVLPMQDLSGSSIPVHFTAGLTDELISTMGQIRALTVKPGLSLGTIEDRSPRGIARALDVDALLETTLSSGGGSPGGPARVKVRARLIAGGTQGLVWSQEFERPRGESVALATDIAAAVTRAVSVVVSPTESARLNSVHQTSPATEEAYLLGRTHLDQYGAGSATLALKAFERALTLDPQHAGAHGGAARSYVLLGMTGTISQAQARAAALGEARRALELEPDLAEAHATLGNIYFIYDWDWSGAEREFVRSLELNANSPYARTHYADYLAALRRFDESLSQAETAKRLDPESGAAARRYALFLYYKHDFTAAERAHRAAIAIEPNHAGVPLLEGRIAEARGLFSHALDATGRAMQLSGGGGVPLRVQEIRQQALAGRRDEAMAGLLALQREAASRTIRLSARDLAYMQLALGNKDQALELFAQAVNERDPTVVWLGVDPRVDILQHDGRFRELLRAIGLPLALTGLPLVP